MNVFTKQPSEIIPVSMNYVNLLNDVETITTLSVTAYDSTGTDVTTTLIYNYGIDGDICKAVVKAGTSGNNYKITFRATTNEGNLYEEDVYMKVREL